MKSWSLHALKSHSFNLVGDGGGASRWLNNLIQVHKKKIEYHEKGQSFLSLISESEIYFCYYIDSIHIEWNILSPYFLKVWWLWLTDNENPKFNVYQTILILHKINKKDILNRNVSILKSILMHSMLAWASFCMNYCINTPISRSRHFEIESEAPVGRNPEVKVNNNDLDYQPRAATTI